MPSLTSTWYSHGKERFPNSTFLCRILNPAVSGLNITSALPSKTFGAKPGEHSTPLQLQLHRATSDPGIGAWEDSTLGG